MYPKLNLNPSPADEWSISQSCRKPRKKKNLTNNFVRRSSRKRKVVKYVDSSDEIEEINEKVFEQGWRRSTRSRKQVNYTQPETDEETSSDDFETHVKPEPKKYKRFATKTWDYETYPIRRFDPERARDISERLKWICLNFHAKNKR